MNFVSIETATHDQIESVLDEVFERLEPGFIPHMRESQAMKLARLAARRHKVEPHDIFGACRSARLVKARRDAWRMARSLGWSLLEIGKQFNRDHTTILHGLRAIK